ncbi:MAG: serine/threonine protein kinase [Candidatus Bruticola sp.]
MKMEGTILKDRYMLTEQLGSGGMGEVYRAVDLHGGPDVAVKLLLPTLCQRESSRERFSREAKVIKQLHHEGLVQFLDHGYFNDRPFIVMELITGQSLRQYIRRNRPSPEKLLTLIAELCEALDYAHRRGIIHRDLKPDNIFVNHLGKIKVLDFGLARLNFDDDLPALTKSGTALGTCTYMSPEQALGKKADPRSDLYSIGVMLYEFFCDLTPFSAEDATEVLRQQVNCEPEHPCKRNPEIPLQIGNLILWLMNKNPQYRPASALILRDHLHKLVHCLKQGAVTYLSQESGGAFETDPEIQTGSPYAHNHEIGNQGGRAAEADFYRHLPHDQLANNSDFSEFERNTEGSEALQPNTYSHNSDPEENRQKTRLKNQREVHNQCGRTDKAALRLEKPPVPSRVTILSMSAYMKNLPLSFALLNSLYQRISAAMLEAVDINGGTVVLNEQQSLKAAFTNQYSALRAVRSVLRTRMTIKEICRILGLSQPPSIASGIYWDNVPPAIAQDRLNVDNLRDIIDGAARVEAQARKYRPGEIFICRESNDDGLICKMVRTIYLRNRKTPVQIYRVIGIEPWMAQAEVSV